MCGCNKGKGTVKQSKPADNTGDWLLVEVGGKVTRYPTQLAAKAANARQGGRGLVRKAS